MQIVLALEVVKEERDESGIIRAVCATDIRR
jgi:hypothetical protein